MTTYRTGNHHGVTIVREDDGFACARAGHDCARGHLVAVVTNDNWELAERIARLLTISEHVDTASKLAYQPESAFCENAGHLDGYSRGLITGYRRAIAALADCARRTGSPAARWGAEYLTVDPDGLRPREDAPCGPLSEPQTAQTVHVEGIGYPEPPAPLRDRVRPIKPPLGRKADQ